MLKSCFTIQWVKHNQEIVGVQERYREFLFVIGKIWESVVVWNNQVTKNQVDSMNRRDHRVVIMRNF